MDRLNTKSLFKKVVFIIILTTFICVTFIIEPSEQVHLQNFV